jgi:hypothetical protein
LATAAVFGQTAERLDAVLAAERVSYAQAAGIILPAAGILSPEAGPDEAFARAREWLPAGARKEASITMGQLSRLTMGAFGLSGGFMYRLFPGPRYAFRAMAWRRLLPPRADPGRTLSGEELLYIAGRVLSHTGADLAVQGAPDPADGPDPVDGPADPGIDLSPGEGVSTGSEGVLPYQGDFEVE